MTIGKYYVKYFLVLTMAIFIASCGGGGSSSTDGGTDTGGGYGSGGSGSGTGGGTGSGDGSGGGSGGDDGTSYSQTFVVTVAAKSSNNTNCTAGSANAYYIDGEECPSLALTAGQSYKFDVSASSTSTHPFKISDTAESGTYSMTVVGNQGTSGAYVGITVPSNNSTMYYWCGAHSGMGNSLQITTAN